MLGNAIIFIGRKLQELLKFPTMIETKFGELIWIDIQIVTWALLTYTLSRLDCRGSPPYTFLDLEKTVLHEIQVSGTALWSPTNTNSPNLHIHKPKIVVVEILLVVFA